MLLSLIFLAASVLLPSGIQQTQPATPGKPPEKCELEGTVIAADSGQPLRKAVLSLRKTGNRARPQYALTDSNGYFEMNGVVPGRYYFSAAHAGYVRMGYDQRSADAPSPELTLSPGQDLKEISFHLPRAAAISGHIYDENGDPIEDAEVRAQRYRYFQGKRQLLPAGFASTDDRGEYRIFDLAPGSYYVSAAFNAGQFGRGPANFSYPDTFYPSTTEASTASPVQLTAGNDFSDVDISLVPAKTFHIRGRVFNAVTNKPGDGAWTRLLPRGQRFAGGVSDLQDFVQDSHGNFDLGGVRAGSYFLIVSLDTNGAQLQTRLPVDVADSDINGLSVTLTSGIDVHGQVRASGGKLTLAGLHFVLGPRHQQDYIPSQEAIIDPKGNLTFQHVGDGSYKLRVWGLPQDAYVKSVRLGGQEVRQSGFDVSEGQSPGAFEVMIDPNGGRVTGIATKDGKPSSDATVVLLPEDPAATLDYSLTQDATTDQYGAFVIRGIRPGKYRVVAFEQIEEGSWNDPNVLSRIKDQGTEVEVSDGVERKVQLQVVPANQLGSNGAG